ncbi:MAG: sugar phosphate isomerase/epimerase family protein [Eubacteriales bacterium]
MVKLKNGIPLSVQSYSYRNFKDKQALFDKVKQGGGLSAVEICGVQVNFADPADVDAYLALAAQNGIVTMSAGINGYGTNEDGLKINFEFARKAGIKVLGADIDVEGLPLIEEYCERYGVKLAIHNHGRHHRYGSLEQLDAIFAKASKNIGVCVDTAWSLDSGIDPSVMIKRYYDRFYGIHFKDMKYSDFAAGKYEEVVCGEGGLKLDELAPVILNAPSLSYASIEFEGHPEDPTGEIAGCVENILKYMG